MLPLGWRAIISMNSPSITCMSPRQASRARLGSSVLRSGGTASAAERTRAFEAGLPGPSPVLAPGWLPVDNADGGRGTVSMVLCLGSCTFVREELRCSTNDLALEELCRNTNDLALRSMWPPSPSRSRAISRYSGSLSLATRSQCLRHASCRQRAARKCESSGSERMRRRVASVRSHSLRMTDLRIVRQKRRVESGDACPKERNQAVNHIGGHQTANHIGGHRGALGRIGAL